MAYYHAIFTLSFIVLCIYLTFYFGRACLGILPSSRSFPVLEEEVSLGLVVVRFIKSVYGSHLAQPRCHLGFAHAHCVRSSNHVLGTCLVL